MEELMMSRQHGGSYMGRRWKAISVVLVLQLPLLLSAFEYTGASFQTTSPSIRCSRALSAWTASSRQPSLNVAQPIFGAHSILNAPRIVAIPQSAAAFLGTSPPVCGTKPRNTRLLLSAALISPEPIHTAFTVATFLPQPFWLLLIVLPKARVTKQIMGGMEIPILCCLNHLVIVASSISIQGAETTAPLSEFNQVFNPFGDPQQAFMGMTSNYPDFVAEEWSHVLTWDLFVGRWIWLDGLRRNIWTAPAILLCNLIGPPGLLLHGVICTLNGQSIFDKDESL